MWDFRFSLFSLAITHQTCSHEDEGEYVDVGALRAEECESDSPAMGFRPTSTYCSEEDDDA